jgi:phosphoribosyl 1,2-cyclic phosphodiesterase
MRVCLLASGSKGNALYVESGACKMLVDAGLSAVEIIRRLATIGVAADELDAILISHEHADHIRGAGILSRKLKIPAMMSYPTHRAAESCFKKADVVEFESGCSYAFRDISIDPFPITHDACDPVGFILESAEGKIGVATDLGIATRLVVDKLQGCAVLVLESNHDEEMLLNGPYPWHLKQRIKSRHGHLSNNDSAGLLNEVVHAGLKGLFLAHLSEVNNEPQLAIATAVAQLATQNFCDPLLIVGGPTCCSAAFTL